MTSYPSLYNPQDVNAGMYPARIAEFTREGHVARLKPAAQDSRRVALKLIDIQWDFVHPTGNLSVPGAMDDLARTVDFIYRNIEEISSIYVSLDTHREWQIFYSTWWQYADTLDHPAPFTSISLNQMNEAVDQNGRLVLPLVAPKWSLNYLRNLCANAQKDLMIWPFHCMEGTLGHSLMPALREALAFYSTARTSQVNFITKGTSPYTEHYGIWATEVPYPKDPSTGLNTTVLDIVGQHDLTYILGQAKKHCVYETARQHVNYFKSQPDVIRKVRFVVDCTSPVPGMPAAFEDATDQEMANWAKLGVQYVTSSDPIR